jgi:predicted TIM-barrel fold metal-dependent hydrolase
MLYVTFLQVGQAMYKKAGELGLPVGHMPFKGLLLHIDEIETLLQLYPETKAIIDHMGFCKCDNLQSEEWQRLLGLAKHPQVTNAAGNLTEYDAGCVTICGIVAYTL